MNAFAPAGARQPRQVNQRETDDPDCESELDGEEHQGAGCRQVGAEAQADEGDAERHNYSGYDRYAKRANDRAAIDRLKIGAQKRNKVIQAMLRDKRAEYQHIKSRGIPRDGAALLHGITYCGECGHKVTVRYKGGSQYVCNHLKVQRGAPECQNLRAAPIDAQVTAASLEAVTRPSASAATAAVAASTAPVIRIRAPAANSISIAPPPADPTGPGVAHASGTTIAGMKPFCCSVASFGSGRNDRRHRSSSERKMPYRRAVAATYAAIVSSPGRS